MPWYTYKIFGGRKHYTSSNELLVAQPFSYNSVIYDYKNDYNLTTQLVSDDSSKVYSYSVLPGGSKYYSFYDNSASKQFVGYPRLIYAKNTISLSFLKEEPTTVISGRYAYNNKTINLGDGPLGCGGVTLPIYVSINNNNFKYLVIAPKKDWSHDYYLSDETYVCGYNNPYNITTSIPPSDWRTYHLSKGSNITLDFGKNPQEIPQFVYDWFIQQFDKVYENTYTIKSVTGETLTTLTEAPPMISATLSTVGNAKYLTLKGENNTNYTMEWTSETPQGKIFAGLATSQGGSIVIPVGETSTINLTDSTDLYEVWRTYRPLTTTFEIKTYNYSGETSRVDKTDYLTPISTLSGVLRGEASLLNFNVLIQSDTVPNFNYCYIDKFKRYYYVTEPVSVRQNLWELTMQVDALMTYKDSLLKCEGYIDRNEYIQNKMIIDNNRAIMQGADFEEDTITNELFGSGSFVLSGLRIGTKEK